MPHHVLLVPRSLALLAVLLIVPACGEGVDVVEAGTYIGTIDRAVDDEKEIYVELDSGRRLELYFTQETRLTRDGEQVPFATLDAGDRVRVTLERTGNRNDPTAVELLSP